MRCRVNARRCAKAGRTGSCCRRRCHTSWSAVPLERGSPERGSPGARFLGADLTPLPTAAGTRRRRPHRPPSSARTRLTPRLEFRPHAPAHPLPTRPPSCSTWPPRHQRRCDSHQLSAVRSPKPGHQPLLRLVRLQAQPIIRASQTRRCANPSRLWGDHAHRAARRRQRSRLLRTHPSPTDTIGRDTGSIFAGDSYLSPRHATFTRKPVSSSSTTKARSTAST